MLSPVQTDAKFETGQTFSYANNVGSCCVLLHVAITLDISALIPRGPQRISSKYFLLIVSKKHAEFCCVLFVLFCFFFQIALINLNIIKAFKTDHRKYVYRQKLNFNL